MANTTRRKSSQSDQRDVDFTLSGRAHAPDGELVLEAPPPAEGPNERAARIAHQAVDKAIKAVRPAADWVNHQAGRVRATQQKVNDNLDNAREYIRESPVKAVGIAVAIGWLINRIL